MATLQERMHETVAQLRSGGPYAGVVGPGAAFAGVDQGIDFTGRAPVYALGSGVVERVEHSGSGWPGEGALVTYGITSGPYKGMHVYVAEDFAPAPGIARGTPVTQGQLLGIATGSGRAPGIEMGFADSGGHALAPLDPANKRAQTTWGQRFEAAARGDVGRAMTLGTGSAADAGSADLGTAGQGVGWAVTHGAVDLPGAGHIPGVQQIRDVAGAIDSVPKLISFLTSWRFAEIVGGVLLLLLGLLLLGRQFGVSPPLPGPLSAATSTSGPIASQPRRVQRRAGFTLPADQKPPRRSNPNAQSDEIPF